MRLMTVLFHVNRAFKELDKIPEETMIDFTGEADDLIRSARNDLDEAIVRLRDLVKYQSGVQNARD